MPLPRLVSGNCDRGSQRDNEIFVLGRAPFLNCDGDRDVIVSSLIFAIKRAQVVRSQYNAEISASDGHASRLEFPRTRF